MANCAPLIADGGSMRIVSRMSAYTWGTYGNTWPEGFNAPEPPGDDRELGFITKLPGRTPGKFGRMFVRADANVDAVQKRSDVEDILDAAAKRTSGEVYFEREIGPEGHGRMVPYVDFDVNDFVPVRVWGRVLNDNLVTEINSIIEAGRVVGYNTHIGGQSWWDLEALRTENREVDKVIGAERRERGDELAALKAEAREYARTQAELAAQAESENLKKYVDERDELVDEAAKGYAEGVDEAAQGYASTAESNATAAAGRYTDTTVKPVRDQSNAIDTDISSAIALVGNKYGVNVSGVAKNRRVTTALDSINTEVEDLNTQHTTLSNKFTTLNTQVGDLNTKYNNALGSNGTLVNDQKETNDKLKQIIDGDGEFVDGSNLVTMFAAWSAMQSVFNDEQVGINDGFQKLFAQQALINAAQLEINSTQSEVNRVQGEINEAQDKINKTLDYNQRYAETMSDARRPHKLKFEIKYYVNTRATHITWKETDPVLQEILGDPSTFSKELTMKSDRRKGIVRDRVFIEFANKQRFYVTGSYTVLAEQTSTKRWVHIDEPLFSRSRRFGGKGTDEYGETTKDFITDIEVPVEIDGVDFFGQSIDYITGVIVEFDGFVLFDQLPGYYADALAALEKPEDN